MLIPFGVFSAAGSSVANSFDLISTTIVTDPSVGNVLFSSIPQTYKHLQIRMTGRANDSVTNSANFIILNGDFTSSNYAYHKLQGNGSSVSSTGATSDYQLGIMPGNTQSSGIYGAMVWDILDYNNTNKFKTSRAISGYSGSSPLIMLSSGLWRNTNAITSIDVYTSNLKQYSRISLYGVK
jgi:hypothetical protein